MPEIKVNLGKDSYPIQIEQGILHRLSSYLHYPKIAVITDENVDKLYGEAVMNQLPNAVKLVLPAGETTKSMAYLQTCYQFLADAEITRMDGILALGGGVIGDLVGFAAATFLRGVPFVQVPTTLLAQVDSSVGGKVAVDLPQGKNLAGAFYQPKSVLIDTTLLQTLDQRQFSCGMAEVIKYGAIFDESLFETLEKGDLDMDTIVSRSCDLKRMVVEADQFDKGERMVLNFGHTYGHCVETFGRYEAYTHGEGVSIGMVRFASLGEQLGITPAGTAQRIVKVCQNYQLPVQLDLPEEVIRQTMVNDKKSESQDINIILLEKIGKAIIHKLPKRELFTLLSSKTNS